MDMFLKKLKVAWSDTQEAEEAPLLSVWTG